MWVGSWSGRGTAEVISLPCPLALETTKLLGSWTQLGTKFEAEAYPDGDDTPYGLKAR
jgi:hypothetical protein